MTIGRNGSREKTVLLERRGRIALITLNRPERANAVNRDLSLDLQEAALSAANDDAIRVILVTGAGKHFCAGGDLRDARVENRYEPTPLIVALDWMPQPVIAVINGAAMGGGCELALSCDFRIMADTAKIGLPEINFGGLPAGGGTARTPRLVGLANARRMIMTGEALAAAEALRIGLVDEVVPAAGLMARAEAFAAQLATYAPYAMRTAKALLAQSLETNLATALAFERRLTTDMGTPAERRIAQEEAAARSATYQGIFSKPDS